MKVREWIELLSEMDPEWEVAATADKDPTKKLHPVMPIEAQDISGNHAPFVRVVKGER